MVFYIGYYADQQNAENRRCFLSATNKMKYIADSLDRNGIKLEIVSCAMTMDKKGYSGSYKKISERLSLKTFRTFGRKNVLTKAMDLVFSKLQLFFYLLRHVKKNDVLLVYHSCFYSKLLPLVKRIKKCRLILELEEIYADVSGNAKQKKKELYICSKSDAFVFPTALLNEVVNHTNKPYIVIHGTYQIEKEYGKIFNDGKIHVVYAGTLDPRKGGATAAAAAAEFLPGGYHVHILGFGSEADVENIKRVVAEVSERAEATVTYDGVLSGEDYIRFIQSCDIGLSTQDPNAAFNATSFPSKILSYMANGLRVVSVRIPAIESSAIGQELHYYDRQTPQEIASAIGCVDLHEDWDGRRVIAKLDERFSKDMMKLLKEADHDF